MTEASAVVIQLPGYPFSNLPSVNTIADLRARDSSLNADGDNITVDSGAVSGDKLGGVFAWNASSVAADDGASTIKPNDLTSGQAGRYITLTMTDPTLRADLAATDGGTSIGAEQDTAPINIMLRGF